MKRDRVKRERKRLSSKFVPNYRLGFLQPGNFERLGDGSEVFNKSVRMVQTRMRLSKKVIPSIGSTHDVKGGFVRSASTTKSNKPWLWSELRD